MKKYLNENWKLKKVDDNKWINAIVPGSMYNDMLSNNLMEDPFYRENEYVSLDLCQYDYEYKCTFDVDKNMLSDDKIYMVFEEFSPSGRTPVSWPISVGHIPSYYTHLPGTSSNRYHNSASSNMYSFGYGLSYSNFDYSDLMVEKQSQYDYNIRFKIMNTGSIDAKDVAQIYVEDVYSSIVTPFKELKGFKKVFIPKNESTMVEIALNFDSFKLLNIDYEWVVEPGEFKVYIGSSCEDIKLETSIIIN